MYIFQATLCRRTSSGRRASRRTLRKTSAAWPCSETATSRSPTVTPSRSSSVKSHPVARHLFGLVHRYYNIRDMCIFMAADVIRRLWLYFIFITYFRLVHCKIMLTIIFSALSQLNKHFEEHIVFMWSLYNGLFFLQWIMLQSKC